MSRDRDGLGRPVSARPRDASGRPLPRGAVGVPPVDESITAPDDVLAAAQGALDEDRPFAAHEYLEAAWKNAPAGERDLWQGLAQVAVGLTHLQRGNVKGARSLLARARERLSSYAGTTPHDIDVDGVLAAAHRIAAHLDDAGRHPPRIQLRRTPLLP